MPGETLAPRSSPSVGGLDRDGPTTPGLLLALLGHVAMRRLRDALLEPGLSPRQFHLLGVLRQHGSIAQSELGAVTHTDPSILVTMLNPLEHDGLVSRRRDPQDRRRHLVTLSEAGERRLTEAAEAQREAENELFAPLDDTQRLELAGLLAALHDGLGADSGSACAAAAADGLGVSAEDC